MAESTRRMVGYAVHFCVDRRVPPPTTGSGPRLAMSEDSGGLFVFTVWAMGCWVNHRPCGSDPAHDPFEHGLRTDQRVDLTRRSLRRQQAIVTEYVNSQVTEAVVIAVKEFAQLAAENGVTHGVKVKHDPIWGIVTMIDEIPHELAGNPTSLLSIGQTQPADLALKISSLSNRATTSSREDLRHDAESAASRPRLHLH